MRQGQIAAGDIYEAILDDTAYEALPSLVAELVGGRSSSMQQFDAANRPIEHQYSYYSAQLVADIATSHRNGPDIWTDAGIRSGILNRSIPLDELVPDSAFRRSALWNEVLRPHGDNTGQSVGCILPVGGVTLCVSVHRAAGEGPFGHDHAARLDALGIDLHRVYSARRLLRERDDKVVRLTHMLESVDARVLLVGLDLRLIEVSPGAQALLDRGDGLSVRSGRLVVADAGLAAKLRRVVYRTIHRTGVGEATFVCERPSGASPWRLLVLPIVIGGASACLIMIQGGQPRPGRLRMWLTRNYGATLAEVAVAEALLEGRSPDEIAVLRNVTINTVRTHVRHLLEKTGARRITELVILLAGLA